MSARSSDWRGAWNGDRSPAVASAQPSSGGAAVSAAVPTTSVPASTSATRRPSAASRSLPDQVAVGHHHGGAGVGEHVRHLGGGEARVHRHGHSPGPVGRRVRHQPAQGQLGVEVDAHPPAGLEAGVEQSARHGVGGPVPLGEGHRPDIDDLEGRAVAEFLRHTGQVLVHQHGLCVPQIDWSLRER